MKLNCYPETDSLYIDLSEKPSIESEEITVGIVLDYGVEGNLAGIDIDRRQEDPTEGIGSEWTSVSCSHSGGTLVQSEGFPVAC